MSMIEFVLAFVGIIIGLGVADLLTSVHKLLRAGKRVKWHWATPCLALLMLLVTLILWWWSYRWFSHVAAGTIADFLPKFTVLVVGFLMVAAALPDDVPASGIDLRDFYLRSRIHLWSLMSITLAAIIIIYWSDNSRLGVAILIKMTSPTMASLAVAVIAALTPRMWVHAIAICWIFTVTVYNNLFMPLG